LCKAVVVPGTVAGQTVLLVLPPALGRILLRLLLLRLLLGQLLQQGWPGNC